MNEDYLWDRSGSDPEIEKFENALSGFRHQEILPPALPAKVVPFTKKPAARFFRYAMAAAACLAFMLLSFGIWTQFSVVTEDEIAAKNNGDASIGTASPLETNAQGSAPLLPLNIEKTGSKPDLVEPRGGGVILAAHKNNVKPQHSRRVKPAFKLTKEEVYAYDQLKLALSITGSKLKLLKDKVESSDGENAVKKNGR